MSEESKTSCVDCVTDDLMVVRPVSAVSFAMRVLGFLCPGIIAYILHGYGPYSSQLTWPWLVFVPAAIVTAVMFVATDIRRCVLGNLIGTKIFISVDKEDNFHLHKTERSLDCGGGPCVMKKEKTVRMVERDPKDVILEIGTGWLRRCRIHGCLSYPNGDWTKVRIKGGLLEFTDRWGRSFTTELFSGTRDVWFSMIDIYVKMTLSVLNHRRGVVDVLLHSARCGENQTEVVGKIG